MKDLFSTIYTDFMSKKYRIFDLSYRFKQKKNLKKELLLCI